MGTQCASPAAMNRNGSVDVNKIMSLSLNKKIKSSETAFESMVQLEARFMSVLPPFFQGESPKYRIKYEVFYGNEWDRWIEEANQPLYTSAKAFWFDYDITQSDQNVYAKISFDIKKSRIQKEAILSLGYSRVDEENLPETEFHYKIDVKYDLYNTLLQKGCYKLADYLNSNIPLNCSGEDDELSGITKYVSDWSMVRASVVERGKNSKRINFALTGKFDKEEGFLMVTIYELIGKHRKLVYETLPVERSVPVNGRPGLFFFEKIEINSDMFETELLSAVQLEFELKRVKQSKRKKESYKVLGSETAKIKSILNLEKNGQLQLNIMKKKKMLRGSLNIGDWSLKHWFTFLDYKLNLDINVIPVIAIDYSLGNLTFDQKRQLIHTLKRGEDNDYISILNHILKVYKNLAPYVIGFGMGGKTLPKQQNASDIFSLSGNMFNPIVEKDDLIEKYGEVFKKIKVSLPINYSPVMELVTQLAQYEKENYEARNFYSLIYLTPGVIDDFDKTLEAAKLIADLPMSVTVVKIPNDQLKDANDVSRLWDELESELKQADRKFFNYLEYDFYKNSDSLSLFEEMLIKDVPINVKRYFSEMNVFAYDLDGEDLATRISVKQKTSETLMEFDRKFHSQFTARKSLVKVKDYLKELRNTDYLGIEENKKEEEEGSSVTEKSRNQNTERGSSEEDTKWSWVTTNRRFSFSKVMEEEYMKNAPVDDEQLTKRISQLVISGQVFDWSKDYLFHLLNSETEQGD
jgi:hypothetical protein